VMLAGARRCLSANAHPGRARSYDAGRLLSIPE
jgi:hypothetical protein